MTLAKQRLERAKDDGETKNQIDTANELIELVTKYLENFNK